MARVALYLAFFLASGVGTGTMGGIAESGLQAVDAGAVLLDHSNDALDVGSADLDLHRDQGFVIAPAYVESVPGVDYTLSFYPTKRAGTAHIRAPPVSLS